MREKEKGGLACNNGLRLDLTQGCCFHGTRFSELSHQDAHSNLCFNDRVNGAVQVFPPLLSLADLKKAIRCFHLSSARLVDEFTLCSSRSRNSIQHLQLAQHETRGARNQPSRSRSYRGRVSLAALVSRLLLIPREPVCNFKSAVLMRCRVSAL